MSTPAGDSSILSDAGTMAAVPESPVPVLGSLQLTDQLSTDSCTDQLTHVSSASTSVTADVSAPSTSFSATSVPAVISGSPIPQQATRKRKVLSPQTAALKKKLKVLQQKNRRLMMKCKAFRSALQKRNEKKKKQQTKLDETTKKEKKSSQN